MESLEDIAKRYKKSLTEKNKECIIESEKFLLYFTNTNKKGEKTFRCKFYRDKNIKCQAYVKFNNKEELIDYNDNHSCKVEEMKIKSLNVRNEAKKLVTEESVIFEVKAKSIYETSFKSAEKSRQDQAQEEKASEEEQNRINEPVNYNQGSNPLFKNIRASIYRYINKNIPKDVDKISEMPEESEYYKTLNGDEFLCYKGENILIFMSEFQASLLYQYNQHIFIDGTFYAAPKASYQIVTMRLHEIKEDNFYTVGYGILPDKTTESYIEFMDNVKTFVFEHRENKRNSEQWYPKTIHCDFELAIINSIRQVFPNSEIKLCLWHLFRNIEINRKKIYGSIENQNQISLNILKRIKTLCFIDPEYVIKVFDLIVEDANESDEKDEKFVKDYFQKQYLDKYNVKDWNYYKIYDHRTNNACESYHHALNSKFNSKPSIWKFISVIREEENNLEQEIENIRKGLIKRKKRIAKFKDFIKPYYNSYDEAINKINNSNINNKHMKLVNLWYEAALELPLYDYNG